MKHSPVFEYLSTETLVHRKQKEYYKVWEICDHAGNSTAFVEFSLQIIIDSLYDFKKIYNPMKPKVSDRIELALEHFATKLFSRKDYLAFHRGLSSATASRDLNNAVKKGQLIKTGDKSQAQYHRKKLIP